MSTEAAQLSGFAVIHFLFQWKRKLLSCCRPHTHTPEGREKYVLALHECDSSASLSMAFTAAPAPKCSLLSHNVAQQGKKLAVTRHTKMLDWGSNCFLLHKF